MPICSPISSGVGSRPFCWAGSPADEQERRLAEPNLPGLVGVAELGEILGVSRQRASELALAGVVPVSGPAAGRRACVDPIGRRLASPSRGIDVTVVRLIV
jgi:hypothetical protein